MLVMSQEKETRISPEIDQVTVFLQQAQIHRTAKLQLTPGKNIIIFENLPTNINSQSIQVSGKGDFTILTTRYQTGYVKKATDTNIDVPKLETDLDKINKEIIKKEALREVIISEQDMLKSAQNILLKAENLKATEVKEAIDYYRVSSTDVTNRLLIANDEIETLRKEASKVSTQLSSVRGYTPTTMGEIIVTINSTAATQASLELTYLVTNAGWAPFYDIKVSDIAKPANFIAKANIVQHTGENWNNVKLTLSTGNPSLSNVKPVLYPWNIDFGYPPRQTSGGFNAVSAVAYESKVSAEMIDARSSADFIVQREAAASIEFIIDIPYTILSGSSENIIEYKQDKLNTEFSYYAVRKLDKDAFLIGKTTELKDLVQLSADANLFFDGTLVGKTYLDARQILDTTELSFGRDKSIIITRVKGKQETTKSILGTTQENINSWDLSVRNTKKQAITITLEDQIPVTTNKEIEIKALETSQAEYDKESGKLTWNLTIQPGETKTLKIKYSVKYPKSKTLVLE